MHSDYKNMFRELKKIHPTSLLNACANTILKYSNYNIYIRGAYPFYNLLEHVNSRLDSNNTSYIAGKYLTIFRSDNVSYNPNISHSAKLLLNTNHNNYMQRISRNISLFYSLQPTFTFMISDNEDIINIKNKSKRAFDIFTLSDWNNNKCNTRYSGINADNFITSRYRSTLTIETVVNFMDQLFKSFKVVYDELICNEIFGAQKILDKSFNVSFMDGSLENELAVEFINKYAGEPFYMITLPILFDTIYYHPENQLKIFFFPYLERILVITEEIGNIDRDYLINYEIHYTPSTVNIVINKIINEYFKNVNESFDLFAKNTHPKNFIPEDYYYENRYNNIVLVNPAIVLVGNLLNSQIVRIIDDNHEIKSIYYRDIYNLNNAGLTLIDKPSDINTIKKRYVYKECEDQKNLNNKSLKFLKQSYSNLSYDAYVSSLEFKELAYRINNYYNEKLSVINDTVFKDYDFLFRIYSITDNIAITLRDATNTHLDILVSIPMKYKNLLSSSYFIDDDNIILKYDSIYYKTEIVKSYFKSFIIRIDSSGKHHSRFAFITNKNSTMANFEKKKKILFECFYNSSALFLSDKKKDSDIVINNYKKDYYMNPIRIEEVYDIMSKYLWYMYDHFNSNEFFEDIIGDTFTKYLNVINSNEQLTSIEKEKERLSNENKHIDNVIGGTQLNNTCNNISINQFENIDDFQLEMRYYFGDDSIINLKKVSW